LTSENRARNQTLWGEVDEMSVIRDVENTELSLGGGGTPKEWRKNAENYVARPPGGRIKETSVKVWNKYGVHYGKGSFESQRLWETINVGTKKENPIRG
jgi:hypothetical protein